MNILAKSIENGGDTLIEHSVATMYLSVGLLRTIFGKKDKFCGYGYNTIEGIVKTATLLHDIGKCTASFQKTLIKPSKKNKKEEIHNLNSWAFLSYYTKMGNSNNFKNALKAILYHHPIEIYEKENYNSDIVNKLKENGDIDIFIKMFNGLLDYLPETLRTKIGLLNNTNNPIKPYEFCELVFDDNNSQKNDALFFIIRTCLIVSDRYVSSISKDKTLLKKIIENDETTIDNIIKDFYYLDNDFNETISKIKSCENIDINRLNNQIDIIVDETKDKKTAIIGAAAGFGKTLIGLLWGVYHNRKLVWVCPRNIIAENTYYSLINELKYFNINNIKIGLFYENEFKNDNHIDGENDYDIIITNIDNFFNPIVKNDKSSLLYNLINSHIIFDEYHEFICEQPLFPQFVQLMTIRHNITRAKTLLLSATPVRLDKVFWNKDEQEFVFYKTYKSHAKDRKHQVFCYETSDYKTIKVNNDSDTCVLLNTVPTTQKVSLNNDSVDNVFHTRFPKKIIQDKKERLIKNHDKYADVNNRFSTISTRIIGTGLDISYSNLIESILSPELTIQAIGRIDRLSECVDIPKEEYYYLDDSSENNMKDNIYDRNLTRKWFQELSKYHGDVITLQDYYNLYEKFNNDNYTDLKKLYEKLYKTGLKQLREMKPYRSLSNKSKQKNTVLSSTTNSYRGLNNSVYVCARYRNKNDKLYAKNKVCDNIIIADHVFSNRFNNEYDKENSKGDNTRKEIIKNQAPKWNKCENGEERLHYKGNKPPYSYPEFKELARYYETPLVMVNFFYDNKIGLYYEDIL